MNRNLPLIPTIVFLLLTLNAVYLYTSKIEQISPTSIQQVVKDNSGTIWALFGDSLIDLSDEKPNRSFSRHGFDHHVGQIIPLASGKWVLNIGAQNNYVQKALQRSILEDTSEYQGSGSLLKCNFDLSQCNRWGETRLQFERAFDGVELDDGRMLIFKAEQKRIFLVDSNGLILSQIQNEELWFGVNKTSNGTWFGLNTDRRELVGININGNSITTEKISTDFKNLVGDVSQLRTPSKVVEYNGFFWLLNFIVKEQEDLTLVKAISLMDMVPSLLSVNIETNTVRLLPYDFNADAEIELIDDSIYFSDFGKYEIKRFDLVSETLNLVGSQNLQAIFQMDEARVQKEKNSLYKWLFINAFAALVVLVWLIFKSVPVKQKTEEGLPSIDVINYGLDENEDQELLHIARIFSKEKPTKFEVKVLSPFKKIDDFYIYYPNGLLAKGRLIPDRETLVSLYKWGEQNQKSIKNWRILPLLTFISSLTFSVFSIKVSAILFVLSLLWFLVGIFFISISSIKRNKIIKTLLVHDSW